MHCIAHRCAHALVSGGEPARVTLCASRVALSTDWLARSYCSEWSPSNRQVFLRSSRCWQQAVPVAAAAPLAGPAVPMPEGPRGVLARRRAPEEPSRRALQGAPPRARVAAALPMAERVQAVRRPARVQPAREAVEPARAAPPARRAARARAASRELPVVCRARGHLLPPSTIRACGRIYRTKR